MFDFTKRDGSNVEHSTIEKIADKGKFNQQKVEDRLRQILDEEYAKGNVTKAIYDATKKGGGVIRDRSGLDHPSQPQPTAAGARGNSNGSSPPEVGSGTHEEGGGVFEGSEQADDGALPQARPIQVLGQNGQGQGAGTSKQPALPLACAREWRVRGLVSVRGEVLARLAFTSSAWQDTDL